MGHLWPRIFPKKSWDHGRDRRGQHHGAHANGRTSRHAGDRATRRTGVPVPEKYQNPETTDLKVNAATGSQRVELKLE